jgi:dextranase
MSAYLSCYAVDEAGANSAAALVMATVWSHGGSHLLLGEDSNSLTGPYYPDNFRLSPSSPPFFASWYDFQVRYGDLLYDREQVDVTEFFTGGINEDFVVEGAAASTKAEPGSVWVRVVRTSRGILVHLINLVDQNETAWDAVKSTPRAIEGLRLKTSLVSAGATMWAASPGQPEMERLSSVDTEATAQVNALSAGQTGSEFALPALDTWLLVFLPNAEFL